MTLVKIVELREVFQVMERLPNAHNSGCRFAKPFQKSLTRGQNGRNVNEPRAKFSWQWGAYQMRPIPDVDLQNLFKEIADMRPKRWKWLLFVCFA
jgi:hypothetical protein